MGSAASSETGAETEELAREANASGIEDSITNYKNVSDDYQKAIEDSTKQSDQYKKDIQASSDYLNSGNIDDLNKITDPNLKKYFNFLYFIFKS
jgi:site-specific recombinase XerD